MRYKLFGIFEKTSISVAFLKKRNRIRIIEMWFKEKVKMRKDLKKMIFKEILRVILFFVYKEKKSGLTNILLNM